MLKLMCNMLADKGILLDQNGPEINWSHIESL